MGMLSQSVVVLKTETTSSCASKSILSQPLREKLVVRGANNNRTMFFAPIPGALPQATMPMAFGQTLH